MDVRIKDIDLIGTVKVVMVKGEKGDVGVPTDSQVLTAVSEWLSAHPEATTTVQDGAITEAKLANDVKHMFDTKADAIIKTASGSIASFDDGGDDLPLKSLLVNIEPKQSGSGDPSPSNVRPISGYESVNVTGCGKNLLNPNLHSGLISGNGSVGNDESVITANRYGYSDKIPSENALIVSAKSTDIQKFNWVSVLQYVDGIVVYNCGSLVLEDGTRKYLGVPARANSYIRVCFGADSIYAVGDTPSGEVQVEAGSTATAYEPYQGNTYPISLGQTVYGGTLEAIGGNGTKTYCYKEFSGNESATTDLGDYWGWVGDATLTPWGASNNPADGVCSHFKFGTDCIIGLNASSGYYFLIKKTALPNISTLAEFKTWVANQQTNGTPLTVCYKLATPTQTFSTTPTEVKTHLGANNIGADTGSVEKCQYRADTTLAYNKLLSAIASLS